MTTIEQIAANILPDVSGSLSIQREQAVIHTLVSFAKQSNAFKFTVEHIITENDVDEQDNNSVVLYPFDLPKKFRPWGIESLHVDGAKRNIYQRNIASSSGISVFDSVFSSGFYFSINDDGSIKLFQFPKDTAFTTATGELSILLDIVCIPDETITEIDDFFYARWGQAIESGAKALMMMQADKPWGNIQMASVHAKIFDAAINSSRIKRNLDESGGELRVEKIPFI